MKFRSEREEPAQLQPDHGSVQFSLWSPVNTGPFFNFCSGGLTATKEMSITPPQHARDVITAQRFSQLPVNQLLKSSRQEPCFLFLFPPPSRPSGTRKHFPDEPKDTCVIHIRAIACDTPVARPGGRLTDGCAVAVVSPANSVV